VPEGVWWRRKKLPKKVLHWIEVSVLDELTRFGYRSILDREVYLPDTAEHSELQEIFEEIRKVGIFFKPRTANRFSSDLALREFCKSINAKGSR
jgi:hypothetical protein